jgi:poly-gamma-glutamate synthesis protein (capsule biosynthesis protein)
MKKVWAIILAGCVLVLGALFFPRLSHAPASLIELFLKRTPVRIGFAGDMMFDRYIRYAGSAHGYDFILASTTELLAHHDAVVANLEGPVTPYASVSAGSEPMSQNNYTFTFSGDVPAALAHAGITVVNIGNNHILNFGTDGVFQTQQFLSHEGIAYFGTPYDDPTLTQDIGGVRVGFISFNEFVPTDTDAFDAALRQLASTTDFTVVFAHWGYEYEKDINEFQKTMAHRFIDEGADLVVGAHTHVIQPHETYRGRDIYYSLGNFVFDQYFSPDVRCGLFLTVSVNPKDFSYTTRTDRVYLESDGRTVANSCPGFNAQ